MNTWLTKDDFIEMYSKIHQRGLGYILSKFSFNATNRTKSTFNKTSYPHANWWIIPEIKDRWNFKISNNPNQSYEDYFIEKHLKGKQGLKLLSLGSGSCSHELNFARHSCFSEVKCIDLSNKLLDSAEAIAKNEGLQNIVFEVADVNKYKLEPNSYDIVLFHSSLHHFKNVHSLIGKKVYNALKEDGVLVIHEYVGPNRLQWTNQQLAEVNKILKEIIPVEKKRRLSSGIVKKKVYGPGVLRMLMTDPSEAIDSESILPAIHENFKIVEEKQLGGNILMLLLKDIAHNFVDKSKDNKELLAKLFQLEDEFLKKEESNLVFGIYKKKS